MKNNFYRLLFNKLTAIRILQGEKILLVSPNEKDAKKTYKEIKKELNNYVRNFPKGY